MTLSPNSTADAPVQEARTRPAAWALETVKGSIRDELEAVEAEIASMVRSDFGALDQVGDHLLSSQGKLFRPAILLLASRIGGGPSPDGAVRLAAVVELLHMATLVHDDAVDHSVTRRGMPTVNSRWSHQVAIIAGDYLYSRAVIEATRLRSVEVVRILGVAANQMTVGEMRQLVAHDALDFSEEDYFRLCRCKTAALMGAAAELGAMLGAPEHREELRAFGEELGMAFQITDDLLDYTASPAVTGKPSGQDLREHKVTLPLIAALPELSSREREVVNDLFKEPEPSERQVRAVMRIVEARGGLDYARRTAGGHSEEARARLSAVPPGPSVRALAAAVDYVAARGS